MKIEIHKREPAPGSGELIVLLDQAEVERIWADYNRMAPFVSISPGPGDDDLSPVNAIGFARCLEFACGLSGFEVSIEGDVVHVTPPVMPGILFKIGVSIRQVSG